MGGGIAFLRFCVRAIFCRPRDCIVSIDAAHNRFIIKCIQTEKNKLRDLNHDREYLRFRSDVDNSHLPYMYRNY